MEVKLKCGSVRRRVVSEKSTLKNEITHSFTRPLCPWWGIRPQFVIVYWRFKFWTSNKQKLLGPERVHLGMVHSYGSWNAAFLCYWVPDYMRCPLMGCVCQVRFCCIMSFHHVGSNEQLKYQSTLPCNIVFCT